MALPVLTPEQRTQALAKAAEARKKRAELKGELKSGKRTSRRVRGLGAKQREMLLEKFKK